MFTYIKFICKKKTYLNHAATHFFWGGGGILLLFEYYFGNTYECTDTIFFSFLIIC